MSHLLASPAGGRPRTPCHSGSGMAEAAKGGISERTESCLFLWGDGWLFFNPPSFPTPKFREIQLCNCQVKSFKTPLSTHIRIYFYVFLLF